MKKFMVAMFMVMSAVGMKAQYYSGDPMLDMITMQAMSQVAQSTQAIWSNVNFSAPPSTSSIPVSWGTGCSIPMVHPDPCVNAAIITAESDRRLMEQGVTVNYNTNTGRTKSSAHSHSSGWYECPCAEVPNFGQVTYHNCANCGARHMKGSHMCKRR